MALEDSQLHATDRTRNRNRRIRNSRIDFESMGQKYQQYRNKMVNPSQSARTPFKTEMRTFSYQCASSACLTGSL